MGDPPADAELARTIAEFKLAKDHPGVPETAVTDDDGVPTIRTVLRPFKGLVIAIIVVICIQAGNRMAPSILFGAVSDLVAETPTWDRSWCGWACCS